MLNPFTTIHPLKYQGEHGRTNEDKDHHDCNAHGGDHSFPKHVQIKAAMHERE